MKVDLDQLIFHARVARRNAYAPYSNYPVGAAVWTTTGKIFTGCNVEIASYPCGTCAETTAIFKAVSEGVRAIRAIAIVTANGASPCGNCRQVISEFAADDTLIVLAAPRGDKYKRLTMKQILPDRFGPSQLKTRAPKHAKKSQ